MPYVPEDPRKFFAQHSQDYAQSPRHARGADLDRLLDGLHPSPADVALDVAAGTGHTALNLAKRGVTTTALDITPEMLQEAAQEAERQGLKLTIVTAAAESFPLSDATFDMVTCRRAAHHFRDVGAFLSECFRVLKPGGRLGISDMTASLAAIDWLNQLERRRDPSHNHALSPDEWYAHCVRAGFTNIVIELFEEPMTLTEWLSPVRPHSAEGQAALAFAQTSPPSELVRQDTFIKRRILLWAHRP